MPTKSFCPDLSSQLEELLWSLWSELGIPGWERRHRDWWIDPEALILFTATLEPINPRLREEALKWCLQHKSLLSTTRAKNLLRDSPLDDISKYQPQLDRFLGTISMAKVSKDDREEKVYPVHLRKPTSIKSLIPSSLISLRLRTLLGVTAKAEIIRIFLARPKAILTAFDLVKQDAGYTKRAIRDALEDLLAGGFVDLHKTGNRSEYEFIARKRFYSLLNFSSLRFPKWQKIFVVLRGLLDMTQRLDSFRSTTRPIEIRRSLSALAEEIRVAGFTGPPSDTGSDFISAVEEWINNIVHSLASGSTGTEGVWRTEPEIVPPPGD